MLLSFSLWGWIKKKFTKFVDTFIEVLARKKCHKRQNTRKGRKSTFLRKNSTFSKMNRRRKTKRRSFQNGNIYNFGNLKIEKK